MKKYELTDKTKVICGITVRRIKALKDFGIVKKGSIGGWIEKEENLSQVGTAWVSDNACVTDNALVTGDACVTDNVWISDNARIFGNACVTDNAWVSGNSIVAGYECISDSGWRIKADK